MCNGIHENIDYNTLILKELLPDFGSYQVVRKIFDTAKNSDYDKFIERLKNPLVKKLTESGKSFFHHKRLMGLIS
jgi:hypothetical protein